MCFVLLMRKLRPKVTEFGMMGSEFEVRFIWPQSPFSKSFPLCNLAWGKKKKFRLSEPFLGPMSPDAPNIILVHSVLNPQGQSHAYRYNKSGHCALLESPLWLPHLFQSHRTQNKHWTGGGEMQRPQARVEPNLAPASPHKECILCISLTLGICELKPK